MSSRQEGREARENRKKIRERKESQSGREKD